MRIDKKLSSGILITNPKKAELFFDINNNTLAIKTVYGQFNVKKDNYESEIYKELKRNIKNNSLSNVYKSSIGFCSNDITKQSFLLKGANAYLISDGTIYNNKLKTDSFEHSYTQAKPFWIIAFFEESTQNLSEFILNSNNSYKIHGCIYNNIYVNPAMNLENIEIDDLDSIIFESINNSTMKLSNPQFKNNIMLKTILYKADNTSIIEPHCNHACTDKIIFKNVGKNISIFTEMFKDSNKLFYISGLDTSNGTTFATMFLGCTNLTTIPLLDTSNGTDFRYMFYNCKNLTTIPLLDTSKGKLFYEMFLGCTNLTSVPSLDTSNGTDFHSMFYNCTNLTTIPLLNTSNGTNFYYMFYNCTNLTSVPLLDTSNGNVFYAMFQGCTNLTSVPLLNTSNGTTFNNMFSSCTNLTTIPLLNTSKGKNFYEMFLGCTNLTTIPSLNTSNGTDFHSMFYNCTNLTSVPLLNTSNGADFRYMFYNCSNLTTIPLLDTSNGTDFRYMFSSCTNLTNLGGFKGLKADLNLTSSKKLTHESLMNVINNLAEVNTNPTLSLGSENLAKLTDDEKTIAINKGWILA